MKFEHITIALLTCMVFLGMLESDWYLFAASMFLMSLFLQVIR